MRVLSVDIGGTQIKTSIVEFTNNNYEQTKVKHTSFNDQLPINSLREAIEKYNGDYEYIGISATGIIDDNGTVIATNGKIKNYCGLNLKQEAQKIIELEKPIEVINDVNAIANMMSDEEIIEDYTLVIALGTGIGGALLYKGELLTGANYSFAELGQMNILGKKFEELASTKALINLARNQYKLPVKNGIDFFELIKVNHATALMCLEEWTGYLASGIETCLYLYNPREIYIGGGISNEFKFFKKILSSKLRDNVNPHYLKNLKIHPMESNNLSGMIGVAKYVRRKHVK